MAPPQTKRRARPLNKGRELERALKQLWRSMVLLLGRGSEGTRERAIGQTAVGIESKRRQRSPG